MSVVCELRGEVVSLKSATPCRSGLASPKSKFYRGLRIPEALWVLMDNLRRPSKCPFAETSRQAFLRIVDVIAAQVVVSKGDEAIWGDASHLSLPALGTERRARRVSLTLKRVAGALAATEPSLNGVGQLIASQRLLTSKLGERKLTHRKRYGAVVHPRSVGDWAVAACTQYILHARRACQQNDVFGVVLDGARIARSARMVYIGYDPNSNLGIWGIAQAWPHV